MAEQKDPDWFDGWNGAVIVVVGLILILLFASAIGSAPKGDPCYIGPGMDNSC